jgi:hypothetical protein
MALLALQTVLFAGLAELTSLALAKDLWVVVLTMWGYSVAQVLLAMAGGVWMEQSKLGTMAGYLAVFWSILVSMPINTLVYPLPSRMPLPFYVNPALLFVRTNFLALSLRAYDQPFTLRGEAGQCLIGLALHSLVFGWALGLRLGWEGERTDGGYLEVGESE